MIENTRNMRLIAFAAAACTVFGVAVENAQAFEPGVRIDGDWSGNSLLVPPVLTEPDDAPNPDTVPTAHTDQDTVQRPRIDFPDRLVPLQSQAPIDSADGYAPTDPLVSDVDIAFANPGSFEVGLGPSLGELFGGEHQFSATPQLNTPIGPGLSSSVPAPGGALTLGMIAAGVLSRRRR